MVPVLQSIGAIGGRKIPRFDSVRWTVDAREMVTRSDVVCATTLANSRVCHAFREAENEVAVARWVQRDAQDELEDHFWSERFRKLLPYVELPAEPTELDWDHLEQTGGMEVMVAAIGKAAQQERFRPSDDDSKGRRTTCMLQFCV